MQLLSRGKVKALYTTDNPGEVCLVFSDRVTAFNGIKESFFAKKGEICAAITARLYTFLGKKGIPTHFLRSGKPGELYCQKVQIIPLEIIIRNIARGSIVTRYGLPENLVFNPPVTELNLKNDALHDPLINSEVVLALGLCTRDQLAQILALTRQINNELQQLLTRVKLELLDFKVEFGTNPAGKIVLADEITPDSLRVRDLNGRQYDKDNYRLDTSDLLTGYRKFAKLLDKALCEL